MGVELFVSEASGLGIGGSAMDVAGAGSGGSFTSNDGFGEFC